MISKKVAMKTPEKSRFGKLVAYLLDPQGKKTRVGEVTITNCVSTDTTWAVREIAATQRLNVRAKSDRTYHLLMSLRAGENPDAQTLRMIQERFCKELGYAEHQRVSVVHHDTDNVHIHVAINKIHPTTLALHDPVRDYKRGRNCARFSSTSSGLPRIIIKGVKPAGTMSCRSPARNLSRSGFSGTPKDSLTRHLGRNFTGLPTLTACGLICAQTALFLLTGARSYVSKRARFVAISRSRRWKLASVLLFPLSINRAGKHKSTRRNLGLAGSLRRACGKNTKRKGNCTKHYVRPSWRAWRSIEPNSLTRLRPPHAPSER
jgi:hypothetical protein